MTRVGTLLEPLDFAFFRNGLFVATLAGALCGLVGVYVVLRRMSYIGHGLSHAIFGGAVVSSVIAVDFYIGAVVWGVAVAALVNAITRRRSIGADAAIGIVTTASFAVGLAIVSRGQSFSRNFEAALFGDPTGVRPADIAVVAGAFVLAAAVIFASYRPLLFTTFDPEVADVSGVRTARIDALFSLVLAGAVIATLRVLGVTLVAATLVIPAVVARMLTDSFARMLALATAIGAACGFVGFNAGYHLDVAAGPAIVLCGAAVFTAVFFVTGARARLAGATGKGTAPGVSP